MATMFSLPIRARALAWIFLAACIVATQWAQPSSAMPQPRLAISIEHWKSATGACTADLEHATVTGVPSDVKARIDASLAKLLATQSPTAPLTRTKREANCAQATADFASYGKTIEHSFSSNEVARWTTGLARGRWLSVRLHVTGFAIGNAHPWDAYAAATFDLDHGGYPVPRSGFYTSAQRPAFDEKLAQSEVAALRSEDATASHDADVLASIRQQIEQSPINASNLLLTASGLEVTGTLDEAFRNIIITLSYAGLKGIGTPGGPLDPATHPSRGSQ